MQTSACDANVFLAEAELFGRYLVGNSVGIELTQRYRAIGLKCDDEDAEAQGRDVVQYVLRNPWALAPLDAACALIRPNSLLRLKLLRMSAVLEATPAFVDRFTPVTSSWPVAFLGLVRVGLMSAFYAAWGVLLLKSIEARRCFTT